MRAALGDSGHVIARAVLGLIAICLVTIPDLAGNRGDFRPFFMTIEVWNAEAVRLADGTRLPRTDLFRLEYWDRRNWTLTQLEAERIVDGSSCRSGDTYRYDLREGWTYRTSDPTFCNGVGRWIHWGIAWSYPWAREDGPEPGQVTYSDPGERIVFDIRTGLPVVYEAGLTTGSAKSRETYRLERYLTDRTGRGSS